LFYNFIENKNINIIFINCREFSKQLNIETISKKYISKICNIIRKKIMNVMHKNWRNNLMGLNLTINGKAYIEIDESICGSTMEISKLFLLSGIGVN
jgi:hypothetical protein